MQHTRSAKIRPKFRNTLSQPTLPSNFVILIFLALKTLNQLIQIHLEIQCAPQNKSSCLVGISWETNTCDKVQKRNPHMALSPSRCILCRENEETIDYLLLQCKAATLVCQNLILEAGFSWAFPRYCSSIMVEDVVGFCTNKNAKFYGIVWCSNSVDLWMERDSKIFEEKEMESIDMFEKAKFTLWASTDKALKEFPFS